MTEASKSGASPVRTLSLLLWLLATGALIGGFCAVSADVSPWPYVKWTAALGATAHTLDLVRRMVRR